MSVLIVTSLGDIVVDLFTDKCPLTCKNFLKLCKIKYYNGCLFHTIQKDFTAQTGDPTGTGSGGDSMYKFLYGDQARFFNDEIHLDLKHLKTGTLAMASAGQNLNASQFYVTLRDNLDYLDGKHTVFGEVAEAEGLETLTRINDAYVDEKSRPYKNIRIKHTYILEDPFDDPPQLTELIPDASPEGRPKDEIGDIPEAEVKPPENVLFVCKLNPVTEVSADEDLHTIFSRFGTVTLAETIRDYKTGDSLCYAFIEFEDKEACEQAYFKMDNALIDDRRIHVDFSQSVSKLWSQYKRKDQSGKGGCFKCGAPDHMARDCTGGPAAKPKYTLKENNRQHGGGDDSRYEMVFDGNMPESPKREKRSRDQDRDERDEKQRRSSEPKRDSHGYHRHGDRNREEKDDRLKRDGEKNRRKDVESWKKRGVDYSDLRGDRRERDNRDDRKSERDHDLRGDRRERDNGDDRKSERDHDHKYSRSDDDYRKRRSDDYRKKSADDDHRREHRDSRRNYK
ncbi:hypothetical protein ACFE04_019249 [Oxalis oulophora]